MQRIVSGRAGERLTFTVKRGEGKPSTHKAPPELREVKDPFGNVRSGLACLGLPARPPQATW